MKSKQDVRPREEIIIDASEGVLGRIASYAAKQSLFGKKVAIVNCNEAIITGKKRNVKEDYLIARRRGSSSRMGPHFPKSPEKIMKRTVRGMLPYKQERGRSALKRVICYDSIPKEYENREKVKMPRQLKLKPIKLSDLSREL